MRSRCWWFSDTDVTQAGKLREMHAKLAKEAEPKAQEASRAETAGGKVDGGDVANDKAASAKVAAEKAQSKGKGTAAAAAAAEKLPSKGQGTIGLGVKLVTADGKQTGLIVSRLVSGGASERSGKISVGHSLATVDGVDVSRMAIKDLAARALAGDPGTTVVIGLKDEGGRDYTVELVRDLA